MFLQIKSMSLIDLNPADDTASTLPRYDPQIFTTTANTDELSNFGFASDIANSDDLLVLSQPNFYRNSLDNNGSVSLTFAGVTNYVFVYQNVDSNWTLSSTISVGDSRDNLGYSVSFSKTTGQYLAIGTYNRITAAALSYVYVSDLGSPPVYTLQETFTTGNFGTIANDTTNIGAKVQLNASGDHLLIMGTTGVIEQFSRSGVTWTHETASTIPAIATYATASAALISMDANADHTSIVRGCPLFPVGAGFGAQTGQVDVFKNSTIASETFQGAPGDRIGAGVALSSNGLFLAYSSIGLAVELDSRLIDTSGYVNIYSNIASPTYQLQTQIVGSTVDASTGSFGNDLAFTQVGDNLVIGDAYANNYQGAQYVFSRADDVWSEAYELGTTKSAAEVVVLDASNNTLYVDNGSAITIVTLTTGSYTGTTLAVEMTTEMTSQTPGTYTVVYDNVGDFFTITRSSGTFNVQTFGTVNGIIGIPGTTVAASSQKSSQLPSFAYNGTELGRNVNISENTATFIAGGLLGAESPTLVNGVGKGLLSVFSTQLNTFQNAVTIDVTDSEAFLVRKNNDEGDVFTIDTRTGDGVVTSSAVVCLDNPTDATTAANGALKVAGGGGISKSLFVGENLTVGGDTSLTGDLIQDVASDFVLTQKNYETTLSSLIVPHSVEIINDEMFLVCAAHTLTGSEIAITSISKANPAIVTTAVHGLLAGDDIVINGNSLTNPTANLLDGEVGTVGSTTTFELRDSDGAYDTGASSGDGLGGTVQKVSSKNDLVLIIYDIGNPEIAPSQLSSLTIDASSSNHHKMYITGSYLFTSNESSSLFVVDITDRTAPTLATTFTTGISPLRSMSGDGKHLFLSTNTTTEIVDISDPLNPFTIATTTPIGGAFAGIQNHSRGHLYIKDKYIYDCTDIKNPVLIHTSSSDFGNYTEIQGNYLYGINGTQFYIRNISETDNITTESTLPFSSSGGTFNQYLKVFGNYVIVANISAAGVAIIDVSDVANPFIVAFPDLTDFTLSKPLCAISKNFLYLWGEEEELEASKLHRMILPTASCVSLDIGSCRSGELSIRKSLTVGTNIYSNGSVQAMGSAAFAGIGNSAISTIGTLSSTDNPLFATSTKRTGSFAMAENNATGPDSLGAAGGDLDFAGQKMFVVEAYVEVQTNSPTNDVWSHYKFVGVNESLVGDNWTLTVTRNGVTDPAITFTITAAGQMEYRAPVFAPTFGHAHIYYEIVSNIV